jgi:hypothetical protein
MSFNKKLISGSALLLILILSARQSLAQHNIRDSSLAFPMIGVPIAYQLPGGDMADRFGNNLNVGASFLWKFKSNLLLGLEG